VRRNRFHREDGFSLAEILVTIAIVGVVFVALLGGLMTSITASVLQRKQASADAVARSAAEWIKDSVQNPYVPCAASGIYSLTGLSVPSGYSVSVTAVQNVTQVSKPVLAPYSPFPASGSQPACTSMNDQGIQLVTVVARSSDSVAVEKIEVIKRLGS
jgi:prepilin-type N-terminal cleavage/methylation domain-containing protein